MKCWLAALTSIVVLAGTVSTAPANWIFGTMDPYPGYYHPSYYFPYAPYEPYPQAYFGGYGLYNSYAGYPPAYYASAFAAAANTGDPYGLARSYNPANPYAPAAPCPPNVSVRYEQRVISGTRPEWKAEKVEIVVPRVTYREELFDVRTVVMVPKLFDATQLCTDYVPVPRQVERVVTTCRTVPYVAFDPCTGCPTIGCQVVPEMHKLSATVFDYQPRVREIATKVCRNVPEERLVKQSRFVPQVTQERTWTIRNSCQMVPYQTTVNVPIYTVCQPPPQ